MIEQAVSIGNDFNLNGVVTIPDKPDQNLEAFVILNSGLMHKIGTCRISVTLARQVVKTNRIVLRFDLSGIGDSAPRATGIDDESRVCEEIITVLDYLQTQYGVSRFVLYGLCSGANNAFKIAQVDQRIVGLVSIDGYSYRTLKFYAVHYLPRMLKLSVWANSFGKLFTGKKQAPTAASESIESDIDVEPENIWPEFPPRKAVESAYQQLVDRKVRLNIIYTGSWFEIYNYHAQFKDMYSRVDFGELLTLKLSSDASHIMSEPKSQQDIIGGIVSWLDS